MCPYRPLKETKLILFELSITEFHFTETVYRLSHVTLYIMYHNMRKKNCICRFIIVKRIQILDEMFLSGKGREGKVVRQEEKGEEKMN